MAIKFLIEGEIDVNELDDVNCVIDFYRGKNTQSVLEGFRRQVKDFFELSPILNQYPLPLLHSVKSRIKDSEHLRDKIRRKANQGISITKENLFLEITDLIGVRVLHLYHDQFESIHNEIVKKVSDGDWAWVEKVKAYTWDPEMQSRFSSLDIGTEIKDSFYTSVHYLVKPNNKRNDICCEIQVRTLFEEIWGEIDHAINYPHKTDSFACAEQLRVLSKLVSTGTRLSDSIFRCYSEQLNKKP